MSDEQQRLLNGIAALEAQRALLGGAVVDLAVGPLHARLRAIDAGSRRALRQVSILFLDMVGSTTLSQHLDPEEIGHVLDGALERATTVVESHGGKTLQYAGDNLLAAFGSVESREDDAERAVRCGLALLQLGKVLGIEVLEAYGHASLDLRVGIHTGGVLLGGGVDEGNSIRGIAVNIAARMEQTAPAGGLRISHDTYSQVRGVFDVAPQQPIHIKGVDAPVTSYLVERAKPRSFRVEARGIEGVATRMIGRVEELDALKQAFERLVQNGANLARITVVAEAGVGKSRLLYEFRNWAEARAETCFVLQARAVPQTQGEPYGLLRDLFAWRLQINDGDRMAVAKRKLEEGLLPLFSEEESGEAEAQVHFLGQLIGLDYDDSRHIAGIRDDRRQIRDRGYEAVTQALRRFGLRSDAPVIVYLDDLHWADDASLDFIDHLAHAARDVPMLIVGLTRPTLFERQPAASQIAHRIDLHPLDRAGSRLLADEILKRLPDIPAALRELIVGGAEGNPFYMEELVKMLMDQGAIVTGGDDWSVDASRLLALDVPPTLTGVLQARLDGLPWTERHALQLASVIGLDFWDAALAFVERRAADQLPPLARRELVRPKEGNDDTADAVREYAFRHQILHQVTYETVLKDTRVDAHAKTARWLVEHGGARVKGLLGTAAEHYERAGDDVSAAEFYARAAEHTASIFANQAALDYIARSLKLAAVDARPLRWRLHACRERLLDLLGRRTEQREDIEALLGLAEALDDDAARAEAAWRLCDYAARTSDWRLTESEALRARSLARKVDDEELALRAVPRLAVAMAYRGAVGEARELAEAGLARAQALGWAASQSRLVNAVTICAQIQRDPVGVLRFARLGLALNRASGDRRAETVGLCNVGNACAALGAWREAGRHLEEALRLARALGHRLIEGNTLGVLSEMAWRQGDDALSLERAEAAFTILSEVGSRHHVTDALASLGNAELALGRHHAAAAAFVRCESMAREVAQTGLLLDAIDGQIRVALARDAIDDAIATTDRLLEEAGIDPVASFDAAANPFENSFKHMTRLTIYRAWSRVGDSRADAVMAAARRALQAEADTISDAVLRESFLHDIPEHRQIATHGAAARGSD